MLEQRLADLSEQQERHLGFQSQREEAEDLSRLFMGIRTVNVMLDNIEFDAASGKLHAGGMPIVRNNRQPVAARFWRSHRPWIVWRPLIAQQQFG